MAESSPQCHEIDEQRLRYLEFVQVATMKAVMCIAIIYEFAKENSGPLRPGVQMVEATVRSVVGPVYERFHDVPLEILKFVDHKVDDTARELEKHVPTMGKETSTQACTTARSVAGEVYRSGVVATATGVAKAAYVKYSPVARDLYVQYEPVAEQYAVSTWRSLNRLPVFPHVAQIAVPTAAFWLEKYNRAVGHAVEKGFAVAEYAPIVPLERIAKVFGGDNKGDKGSNGTDDGARDVKSYPAADVGDAKSNGTDVASNRTEGAGDGKSYAEAVAGDGKSNGAVAGEAKSNGTAVAEDGKSNREAKSNGTAVAGDVPAEGAE